MFEKADELDDKKFKEFRVETKKVTIKSVLEINHLKLKDLKKRRVLALQENKHHYFT